MLVDPERSTRYRETSSLRTIDYRPEENTTVYDAVNHPSHYTGHPSGVECLEITRHLQFNVGNAFKYVWRTGLKDTTKTTEDLLKAEFYLEDYLEAFGPTFTVPDPARDKILATYRYDYNAEVAHRDLGEARLEFLQAYLYGSATEAVVAVRRLIAAEEGHQ